MGPLTAQCIVNKALTSNARLSPDLLLAYLQDVLRWNPQLGLVSRRDPLAVCERLILESLELLTRVRADGVEANTHCADVGSGGGFPGVVWALVEPEWRFLLIERKAGRAAFLQAVVARLSLPHVDVFVGDVEEAVHHAKFIAAFDVVVAMAVAAPVEIGPDLEPLLVPGGRFYGTVAAGAELPGRIGKSLDLKADSTGDYGNYATYQSSVVKER
jgi:16S rRNA (guanine527-N7)-methyltransferase